MSKELIIVFVKNIKLGKVKTRLAKTIGNQGAFEVYSELVKITELATENMLTDKRIYFSDVVIDGKWKNDYKTIQEGKNLGERMKNAFKKGFEDGYERIVLIGSDLPDISSKHIENGLKNLNSSAVVFGPAIDGGYYLIGMTKMYHSIFNDKPWSESHLLEVTLKELNQEKIPYTLLEALNDIDTFEDLENSSFYQHNEALQLKVKSLIGNV
ncbi:TIGR04282 family arsenosugar biosynthesis glycosyltransferase [Flavivirga spongiicola]|uniref:TIGR04282 family arsenosugar biosynthesis glycosyltransferase n=1 Tax=Flavivirga spongiicola TaxID=421621 RepID=A0ABU7XQV2_9FLAO|nr:TIGR04282 family arsenosugar biosynthesis glycosyltransferase [Flavivirga sp. MEBiC05379]MDO5978141.1 TIGR04282 family arsenosugar biosynthesis glycosyltransferase [Flavivirga sp. MEBiC05379]